MPPAEQVRDALERILSSDAFARSERARELLGYLVGQDLAGQADRLKGFSIAVDVFGKDGNFDPATDTVVRVQAGRLRDLLEQYYAGEGTGDLLRIAIPRGTYVPEYRQADAAAPEPIAAAGNAAPSDAEESGAPLPSGPLAMPPATADDGARRRGRLLWLAAIGGVCVIAGLAGILSLDLTISPASRPQTVALAPEAPSEPASGSLARELLPTVFVDSNNAEGGEVERVVTALRRGLTAFDTVNLIARAPVDLASGGPPPKAFVFNVTRGAREGEVHVELQHLASATVLKAVDIPAVGGDQQAVDDDVAELLTIAAPESGLIYGTLAEQAVETPLIRCLALNDFFYRNPGAANHRAAYECFEQLAAVEVRSPLIYSELSSLHLQALTSGYKYPSEVSAARALELARAAVHMGPGSPYAHRAMGYVMSRTVNVKESIRWTRRAYELNTFDLAVAAAYGYALVFGGEYADGAPVLLRAVRTASSHPLWWDYGLFLGQFMIGDMQEAAQTVSALASSKRAHYVAARLIVAHALGDTEAAAALLAELRDGHSAFAADPEAFFRRGNYPPDLTARLVAALGEAGLASAGPKSVETGSSPL